MKTRQDKTPLPHQSFGFTRVLGATFQTSDKVVYIVSEAGDPASNLSFMLFCKKDESTVSPLLINLQYLQVIVTQVVFFNLGTTFSASSGGQVNLSDTSISQRFFCILKTHIRGSVKILLSVLVDCIIGQ